MLSHAEIYRRVCEARNECVCPNVGWTEQGGFCVYDCLQAGDNRTALALITDFWMGMLPGGKCVVRCSGINEWAICTDMNDDGKSVYGPTRFHALAELLVPGSTKEKA